MHSSSLYGNRHSKPESNTQDEKHELKKAIPSVPYFWFSVLLLA